MTPCDQRRLQKLLDESLPEAAEHEVAEHLASCSDCQSHLEELAAGPKWWVEASQRLSKSAVAGPNGDSSSQSDAWHEVDAHHFATDFAVDFLDPSDDPQKLGRLGEYEIEQVIGHGGMGIVLKGFQKELNRFVAVKVLSPHLATSGAARRRFAREAQATAAIVHPHVMAIHSVNANAKLPYLVMPFVACESLQERLDRQGPLAVTDVLRIGIQAALGLAAAHAQGLVHRDVKPANILLETTVERVMLTDFGLARAVDDATLTRTGVVAGTPQYMSPEQANGDAIDHRSDLFSLGGVLYAMCTGRPPFRAETTFGVLRRIRESAPRPIREINPEIPEWLERIVLKLLSKEAAGRIASAEQVASLLERCLAHVQQPMSTPLPLEIQQWIPKPSPVIADRRRKVVLAAASMLVAVVLIPIIIVAFQRPSAPIGQSPDTSQSQSVEQPGESPATWNAIQEELDDIGKEIQSLEQSARRDLNASNSDLSRPGNTARQEINP